MKTLKSLVAVGLMGLAGCGPAPKSEVYLNSPIANGYDVVVTQGRYLRIGNLENDSDAFGGWKDLVVFQGDLGKEPEVEYIHVLTSKEDLVHLASPLEAKRILKAERKAHRPRR